MGKYQLDDKGKAQVRRFHEKHSTGCLLYTSPSPRDS